jgi:hypothetical protein
MKAPYAGDLVLCVFHLIGVDGLLGLESRVDALGRNDLLALVVEDERRIQPLLTAGGSASAGRRRGAAWC